jgi:catechol 2,3-dioxygenase-like lactoylglutathione lyase family enzyme
MPVAPQIGRRVGRPEIKLVKERRQWASDAQPCLAPKGYQQRIGPRHIQRIALTLLCWGGIIHARQLAKETIMPQAKTPPRVSGLDHLVLTVADIARTVRFYESALGMRAIAFTTPAGEVRHSLRFGRSKINLHLHGAEFEPKSACPTPGSADLCFLTEAPLARWQERLGTLGVAIEEGPVPRTGAEGPITSLYIRDPDGNLIEISVPDPAPMS